MENTQSSSWPQPTGTRADERHDVPTTQAHTDCAVRGDRRQLRTAVAVSRQPVASSWIDSLSSSADYDIVYVASVADAGPLIRRTNPDAVVVCLELDDPMVFHLLSMLKAAGTSEIPVILCAMIPAPAEFSRTSSQLDRDSASPSLAVGMMN